ERPVEAEQVAVALELFLAGILGQEQQHGIAQHVQDAEGQHGDAEHDDDELDDLAGEVASHSGASAPAPLNRPQPPPPPPRPPSYAGSRPTSERPRPAAPRTRSGCSRPTRHADPT